MTDFFPIGELVDRYLIAVIKNEKTGINDPELQWYKKRIDSVNISCIQDEIAELKQAHLKIWAMESSLRSGLEEHVGMDEIGRRAVIIRNYNAERVAIKNRISQKLNCPIVEIKKDHISDV